MSLAKEVPKGIVKNLDSSITVYVGSTLLSQIIDMIRSLSYQNYKTVQERALSHCCSLSTFGINILNLHMCLQWLFSGATAIKKVATLPTFSSSPRLVKLMSRPETAYPISSGTCPDPQNGQSFSCPPKASQPVQFKMFLPEIEFIQGLWKYRKHKRLRYYKHSSQTYNTFTFIFSFSFYNPKLYYIFILLHSIP